jgi:hypothetical protein
MAAGIHKSLLRPPMAMRRFQPPGATCSGIRAEQTSNSSLGEAAQCIAPALPWCVIAFHPT